nr:hypothetical protein [Tanacetum cinerariifolium]
MLNKDNYVPYSSCLFHFAKSKPNGKLIYNFIMNGPYVRRMILEPGDPVIANLNVNQNGNGNVLVARDNGNGNRNNKYQIRCYNCRGLGHLARKCTIIPRKRDVVYLQTHLLIAQKEEAIIHLQAEEFYFNDVAGDLDEIEEVNANYILLLICSKHRHRVLRLTKLLSMTQMDQL